MLRSWADKEEWTEWQQRERVKAAMSDMQQGGAAVLMEGIPAEGGGVLVAGLLNCLLNLKTHCTLVHIIPFKRKTCQCRFPSVQCQCNNHA